MIHNQKKSVKEAAQALGTSESYVRKVLSMNKIDLSIPLRSKSEDKASSTTSEMDLIDTQKGLKKKVESSIPKMKPEIRKALYRWLDDKKPLTGFVKLTGIDGLTVEEENHVYLKLKDADRYDLQQKLLTLVGYEKGDIDYILSVDGGPLLSNTSLLDNVQAGIDIVVKDTLGRYMEVKDLVLPTPFRRPKCLNCGTNLLGVLISSRVKEGQNIAQHIGDTYLCINCRQFTRRK